MIEESRSQTTSIDNTPETAAIYTQPRNATLNHEQHRHSQEDLWRLFDYQEHLTEGIMRMVRELGNPPEPTDYAGLRDTAITDRLASVTTRRLQDIADEHARSTDELLDSFAHKTVLNIGAGRSSLAEEVASRRVPARWISLDIDEDALRGQPGETIHASAEDIPLPDESCDIVLATNSLPVWAMSIKQAEAFFSEVERVLAPGGQAMIAPIGLAQQRVVNIPGARSSGMLGEIDPRNRLILGEIDLATFRWIRTLQANAAYTVTLESSDKSDWGEGVISSVTITKLGHDAEAAKKALEAACATVELA